MSSLYSSPVLGLSLLFGLFFFLDKRTAENMKSVAGATTKSGFKNSVSKHIPEISWLEFTPRNG
jgi:hypothetical protein